MNKGECNADTRALGDQIIYFHVTKPNRRFKIFDSLLKIRIQSFSLYINCVNEVCIRVLLCLRDYLPQSSLLEHFSNWKSVKEVNM